MTDKIVVLSTCGSREEAEAIARRLLERRLAACVNVLPGVSSLYHWKNAIEQSEEVLMIIKSARGLFSELSAELRKQHSYEVPEAIALPVSEGSDAYLGWMERELSRPARERAK